jgi:hypothetical protein
VLAKDMMGNLGKNFKQGSGVAETAAIGGAGLAGGIRGGYSYAKGHDDKFSWREMGNSILHGHTPKDSEDKFGGITNWGNKTRNVTRPARVFMDRLSEGRAFDPEDLTKMIAERLAQGDKKGTDSHSGGAGDGVRFVRPTSGKKK